MFRFVKQIAISTLMFFNSLLSVNPLECITMKNQECKVRSEIVDVNARICIPDIVKNWNV